MYLVVNYLKSEVFFSRNTLHSAKHHISSFLGVSECLGTGKYLELPSMIGRRKKTILIYLRDRIWKRIIQWSSKHLSKAGREAFIKFLAQAIFSYCMILSSCPLPWGMIPRKWSILSSRFRTKILQGESSGSTRINYLWGKSMVVWDFVICMALTRSC